MPRHTAKTITAHAALARERANTHVESTALRLKTGQQTSEDKPKIGRKR